MLRPSDSTLLRSQLRIRRLHPLLELGEQRTRVAGVLSIHPQTETALREAAMSVCVQLVRTITILRTRRQMPESGARYPLSFASATSQPLSAPTFVDRGGIRVDAETEHPIATRRRRFALTWTSTPPLSVARGRLLRSDVNSTVGSGLHVVDGYASGGS